MEEENGMTKSAMKNTRWALLEQRMTFIEKSTHERLCRVEDSLKDMKENELAHLTKDIGELRGEVYAQCGKIDDKVDKMHEKLDDKISGIQKIIYKAVGAVGAVLTILNVILKIWK